MVIKVLIYNKKFGKNPKCDCDRIKKIEKKNEKQNEKEKSK